MSEVVSGKADNHIAPENLYILHLSDLHIGEGLLSHAHRKLIDDAAKQLHGVKQLVVVVTGDIVQQCDYSEANVKTVCQFFTNLQNAFPKKCRVLAVEVVPGNHEIVLPVKSNGYNDGKYYALNGKYEELKVEILKTFGIGNYNAHSCVTPVDYQGKSICFVRVDTSWTKKGEEIRNDIEKDLVRHSELRTNEEEISAAEKKILKVAGERSERQKVFVSRAYSAAVSACEAHGKPVVCTFVLSHFPITWLLSSPYEKVRSFLFCQGLSDVNVWLCGHAHNVQLYFNNDDARSTLMLMTGVGREESEQSKHRYSIYRINLERNIIDVKVRSIGVGATVEFGKDDELYGKLGEGFDYYPFPLVCNQAGAFHRLNAAEIGSRESILLDKETIAVFREISLRMGILYARLQAVVNNELIVFEKLMAKKCPSLRNETHLVVTSDIEEQVQLSAKWRTAAFKTIKEDRLIVKLLTVMASEIEEVFTQILPEAGLNAAESYVSKVSFKGVEWRAHFRKYRGSLENGYSKELDEYAAIANSDIIKPKVVPYEGMIASAVKSEEKMVVKSVSGIENPIQTNWSDFLTGVPDFPENKVAFNRPMPAKERPLLTYGISVRYKTHEECQCASRILCGMDFAMLNRCVSYALGYFVQKIRCDFGIMINQAESGGDL